MGLNGCAQLFKSVSFLLYLFEVKRLNKYAMVYGLPPYLYLGRKMPS